MVDKTTDNGYNVYTVKTAFTEVYEQDGSVFVVAKSEDEAKQGALDILSKTPSITDPVVTSVALYNVEPEATAPSILN